MPHVVRAFGACDVGRGRSVSFVDNEGEPEREQYRDSRSQYRGHGGKYDGCDEFDRGENKIGETAGADAARGTGDNGGTLGQAGSGAACQYGEGPTQHRWHIRRCAGKQKYARDDRERAHDCIKNVVQPRKVVGADFEAGGSTESEQRWCTPEP